jgi:hypothetical protein
MQSPRRRAASLIGTLRPGRTRYNRAVAGRSVAVPVRYEARPALLLRSSPPAGGALVAGASSVPSVRMRVRRRRRCPSAALSEGTHHNGDEATPALCPSDRSGGPVLTLRGRAAACREGQSQWLRAARAIKMISLSIITTPGRTDAGTARLHRATGGDPETRREAARRGRARDRTQSR